MAQDKELKTVSPRAENIIKGIFLVLFSIVLALNIGKVGRTLTFLPLYLFGTAYYFLCAFGIFVGGYRIFKQKKFKFNSFLMVIGEIVLFFSLVIIMNFSTQLASGRTFDGINFGEYLALYNGQLGNYYANGFMNIFDPASYWGGGLIGVLICGLVSNNAIAIFLGIILFILATLCFVAPIFIKNKDKRHEKKKEKKAKKAAKEEAIRAFQAEHKPEVDDNPVISRAPVVEAPKPEVGFENDKDPFINENSGFNQVGSSLDETFNRNAIRTQNNEYNEFTPLVFNSDNSPFQRMVTPQQPQAAAFPAPVAPVVTVQEDKIDSFVDDEPVLPNDNIVVESQPAATEQPQEHQIDNTLVRMEPQFIEPQVINQQSVSPQPVIEEEPKKKRERVVWVAPNSDILAEYKTEEQQELNQKVADERTSAPKR